MQLNNAFNKVAYFHDRRFNHSFFGAILDTLKITQHKYDRHHLGKLYRFIADIIENGDFDWSGTFPLIKEEKSAKIETKKGKGK